MNIRIVFIGLFLGWCTTGQSQRIGEWKTYLASYYTTAVVEADNQVYALANGTLYSYGKADKALAFYSRQTGLSDSEIKLIGYSPDYKTLLIVYKNGNIDLLTADGLYNLPYLKNATHIPNKEPVNLALYANKAYITTNFGIVVLNLSRKEITETYNFNTPTQAVCIQDETIYAATQTGLRKARVHDNLIDNQNWVNVVLKGSDIQPQAIRQLAVFENTICLLADKSGAYTMDAEGHLQPLKQQPDLRGMKLEAGRLLLVAPSALFVYTALHSVETVPTGDIHDASTLKGNGEIWLASGEQALVGIKQKALGSYEVVVAGLRINSPKRNLAAFMTVHGQKLLVAGGGRRTDRFKNPGTLMTYENGAWTNLNENDVDQKVGYPCEDYTGVAVDPTDASRCFVSSFGEGVLEFKDGAFVALYNHTNSALQTIFPTSALKHNYVRVGGVCFDKKGYLWMTNSSVQNGLVVRRPDGVWKSLYYPGVQNKTVIDKILITKNGHKWVNIAHDGLDQTGILMIDDRGTPDDASDDASNFVQTFSNKVNPINGKKYYCVVEDQKGEIWMGTDKGPIVCSSPPRVIKPNEAVTASYIIRTDKANNSTIFLGDEQINAMVVDGGNRKWIGTASSGLFLVSSDALETLLHFDMNNSPLPSNMIESLAINHETGEVFVGTNQGILSYRSEATAPKESYAEVYAYPNPVRLGFDEQVVVAGLMANSNVKITDLAGNLICQGQSAGGQFMWNCRNHQGDYVASGIYLVLSSTPQAKQSVVAKIAVVK